MTRGAFVTRCSWPRVRSCCCGHLGHSRAEHVLLLARGAAVPVPPRDSTNPCLGLSVCCIWRASASQRRRAADLSVWISAFVGFSAPGIPHCLTLSLLTPAGRTGRVSVTLFSVCVCFDVHKKKILFLLNFHSHQGLPQSPSFLWPGTAVELQLPGVLCLDSTRVPPAIQSPTSHRCCLLFGIENNSQPFPRQLLGSTVIPAPPICSVHLLWLALMGGLHGVVSPPLQIQDEILWDNRVGSICQLKKLMHHPHSHLGCLADLHQDGQMTA